MDTLIRAPHLNLSSEAKRLLMNLRVEAQRGAILHQDSAAYAEHLRRMEDIIVESFREVLKPVRRLRS